MLHNLSASVYAGNKLLIFIVYLNFHVFELIFHFLSSEPHDVSHFIIILPAAMVSDCFKAFTAVLLYNVHMSKRDQNNHTPLPL